MWKLARASTANASRELDWGKAKGPGFRFLHRLNSSIKTPITNTTKAVPNNAISIKVMTLTVYLPTFALRARKAVSRGWQQQKGRSPFQNPGPASTP
jgi:hypothetical protein